MAMPVPTGSIQQPLDFLLSQILSGTGRFHCYIYYRWSLEMGALNFHNNLPQFMFSASATLGFRSRRTRNIRPTNSVHSKQAADQLLGLMSNCTVRVL
jgi:hypothetical protein